MNNIRLYANCKVSRGYNRDVILDLEQERFFLVPHSLTALLEGRLHVSHSDAEALETIAEYKQFLVDNNLAFEARHPIEEHTTLSNDCFSYSTITNCTLLLKRPIDTDSIQQIILLLEMLQVEAVLIVAEPEMDIDIIAPITDCLSNSPARHIEVALSHQYLTGNNDEQLALSNPRISTLIFYEAPANSMRRTGQFDNVLRFTTTVPYAGLFAQQIQQYHFIINIKFYTESVHFNPFYYGRLILDSNGNIYENIHSSKPSGNIASPQSISKIQTPKQDNIAFIAKDRIDVCKDCEFKNICPDNRIPIKKTDGSWYHQDECNYNPFISKWKGEKGYVPLAMCGVISNADGLSVNGALLDKVVAAIENRS